jgi:hypothetical protein
MAQEFKLPFKETWFIVQGGDTLNVNHHMKVRAQWYGLDFMKVGGPTGRGLRTGTGKTLEDFFSWEAEVISPGAGKVFSCVDGLPDNPIGTRDPANPAGNHVVIETTEKTFVFIAHLKKGSVFVKPGQEIIPGTLLGHCGNSGNSDCPHIHLHLQDSPALNSGNGLNIIFNQIKVSLNGKVFEAADWPLIRGLFVSNQAK